MESRKILEKKAKPKKKLVGHKQHTLHLLRKMLLIRRFEEKAGELYTLLKIRGFLHLYIGEEAVAVGVMEALKPEDAVVATYREHGHALARGMSASAIMAEMYGKQEGCSRGRGGSMHLFDALTRFYGGNAIVGGGLPLAAGLALADKMQRKPRLTCCFFGEGAMAEGEFHETMNLSALWQLPVLFVCENNLYAMGTALERSESVTNLIEKTKAYGVEGSSVDGMDVVAVEGAAKKAASYVRTQQRPYFLECKTYRFRAHSMFDAELYRSKSEVETWKQKDPITTFIKSLKDQKIITKDVLNKLEREISQEIQQAVDFAEQGTWEPVEELSRFVYSEPKPL
ncbi:pyruvate dehydrogenase (acetyl-transferring) E1 component subunit alpha [Catalinimonas niigatensis]|uniref:pyruvate dehydrogenase (acetyl-transferring) E1 component subunit alpha n=1 Tax=Catalinimonas niigatensis TaxID=1397264 RepID=UPI00266574FA|nr:pyruvate dehydrogenase (acetyl-transferring) E1 component subunit alpha [Catalinimonas niigatensis]WPP49822.1 pyruvate dehydrogenase (acetyl-transferring) E1 component subunit alpha [Catalinimonas niigatensis]